MIDLSLVNASDIIKLGEDNVMYTAVGIGDFAFTTVGSVLVKCFLSARRKRKEEKKLTSILTESLARAIEKQPTTIISMQDVDLEKGMHVAEPDTSFEVVDVVDTPKLIRSQSTESVNAKREW